MKIHRYMYYEDNLQIYTHGAIKISWMVHTVLEDSVVMATVIR